MSSIVSVDYLSNADAGGGGTLLVQRLIPDDRIIPDLTPACRGARLGWEEIAALLPSRTIYSCLAHQLYKVAG
jgi:hypothetical protein